LALLIVLVGDPVAEFSFGRFPILKKNKKHHRRGRLIETAATMEKSKTLRCFFPQLLGKAEPKTCSALSTVPTSPAAVNNK
jgi:hypothetical protein